MGESFSFIVHPSKHLNIIIHSNLQITRVRRGKINNWVQRLGRRGWDRLELKKLLKNIKGRPDDETDASLWKTYFNQYVNGHETPAFSSPVPNNEILTSNVADASSSIQSCLLKSRLLFKLVIKASHFQSKLLRQNRIVPDSIGYFWLEGSWLKLAILWSTHPWAFVSGWFALDVWMLRNFSI